MAGEWKEMVFKVLSNPTHSMISDSNLWLKNSGQIPSLGWPVLEVSSKLITPASFWRRWHIRCHVLYIYLSTEPPPQMPEKKLFSKAVFSFPTRKFIRAPFAACKRVLAEPYWKGVRGSLITSANTFTFFVRLWSNTGQWRITAHPPSAGFILFKSLCNGQNSACLRVSKSSFPRLLSVLVCCFLGSVVLLDSSNTDYKNNNI